MNGQPDRPAAEDADDELTDTAEDLATGDSDPESAAVSVEAELQAKVSENWEKYLRAAAELENVRKRAARDVENAHKFALERFANELLPVKDSLEMGLTAFDVEGADPDKLREGVALTLQMLTGAMGKVAIKEVNPQDERFNPDFHQAMSMQERDDVEPNTVVTVVQKGYTLNERLIRPAMVIVSKAPGAN